VSTPPAIPAVDSPLLCGPQKSERFGVLLGIDIGDQEGSLAISRQNRMPRASVVVTSAARTLIRLSKAGEKVESLVVYGTASEPTMHPEFREIVGNLRDLRNKWFSKAKLILLSEDPRLEGEVRHAIGIFDRVVVRYEWGTAKTFASATGRKSTELAGLATSLGHIDNLIVQARFLRGDADNSTEAEVRAWIKKLGELKPREIHLLTSVGKGASKKAKPVTKTRIGEIAAEVTEKTGLPVQQFAGESLLS
jgi:hypothetical protein